MTSTDRKSIKKTQNLCVCGHDRVWDKGRTCSRCKRKRERVIFVEV